MENKNDLSELERIINDMDTMDVKEVFKKVRSSDSDSSNEIDKESSKYKGDIKGIVTKEEYEELPYLGKKCIQFMENYVADKEDLTFEDYFERYANTYGKDEINSFKNTIYRLKTSKVFTIQSLISIVNVIGYEVHMEAEEFKPMQNLRVYKPKRKVNASRFMGKLHFELDPNVVYEDFILEFITFLEDLGDEGYTFEMLFGELEYNSDERNPVNKLKSTLDKLIKQGKLTWKTMETVSECLGMNLKVDFKKDTIDTDEIKKFDASSRIKLRDDDITKK
ncbi:hypothetical protein [Staphylococcus phage vB_StaM_SA1]|nr:hypothetical protein [Staphylococcus phage vB_StaM_SA1]